MLKYNDFLEIV